jgi:hypothetical protein
MIRSRSKAGIGEPAVAKSAEISPVAGDDVENGEDFIMSFVR